MDAKNTSLVAYITWLGFFVALLAGDKEGAKFHLNQALVILIFFIPALIPCLGQIWGIFMMVCWILGLVAAINQEEKEGPLIGRIRLLK